MNAYENTDKEIWRKIEGEYYSPRIFVTEEGGIGIDVGGYVYVQSVEEWHKQADRIAELEKDGKVCATCGGLVYDSVIKQTKPLSDEEIRKIAIQCDAYDNDGSLITDDICIDKFARAIEERHGIK